MIKNTVIFEMDEKSFRDIRNRLSALESTLRMIKTHDAFKQAMFSDIKNISKILVMSKKGGTNGSIK